MRIFVQEANESPIHIWIPYCFLSGKLIAKIINKNSSNFKLTPAQINMLVKGLKQVRKQFGKLVFVEVESKDQDHVKITL